MSSNKHRQTFTEINITPLTDIFLVLLIIMMVIAPLLDQQGLNLIVPNTQEETKEQKESKLITVDVAESGVYTIDGRQISSSELVFVIKDLAKEKKDGLLIQAAGNSTHGAVVTVMDAARNAGVSSISSF
ncbi:MAG: biopolymer transporter ExbD [Desulfosudis oleivorans]|nr:biopolymer transporter ExbD [Desulfosudis oleivorans]